MKIAFIGLGAMGYPMARHVAEQHEVTVWNRSTEVSRRHSKEHGTRVADELRDCASQEVVFTILPTSVEVDEVVDTLLPKLRKGTLWIDATSGDPMASRKTASRLAEKGVSFVDAPVTGGTNGAEAGTLTVMVGGGAEDYVKAGEVLKTFGSRIVHVGEVGAGHAVKAMNNAMMAANMWMTAECLLSLRRMGVSTRSALEVINSGSGRSFASQDLIPKRILDGEWPLTFKLSLHDKDIRIAALMAHSERVASPMLSLTSQLFMAASKNLGSDADYVEAIKYAAMLNAEEW